jgi:AraC-like DNA-binding protein
MIQVKSQLPAPELRAVIASFGARRGDLAKLQVIRPLHARPDQFMEFYFKEPYRVRGPDQDFRAVPDSVLVGLTTRPGQELAFVGEIETFTIRFQPTGLHRLFGLPMGEMCDQGIDLGTVFGASIRRLQRALFAAMGFQARVTAAQAFFGDALATARKADDMDRLATLIARSGGIAPIAHLADRFGLSARQVQRRFVSSVGVSPKFYSRLHRLDRALSLSQGNCATTWAQIAAHTGFADEAHLSREFRALCGEPPATLLAQINAIPIHNSSMD